MTIEGKVVCSCFQSESVEVSYFKWQMLPHLMLLIVIKQCLLILKIYLKLIVLFLRYKSLEKLQFSNVTTINLH